MEKTNVRIGYFLINFRLINFRKDSVFPQATRQDCNKKTAPMNYRGFLVLRREEIFRFWERYLTSLINN